MDDPRCQDPVMDCAIGGQPARVTKTVFLTALGRDYFNLKPPAETRPARSVGRRDEPARMRPNNRQRHQGAGHGTE